MVSVEDMNAVTISPSGPGRKYRFLVYALGKRRHGPLTAEGTTGEGSLLGEVSLGSGGPWESHCGYLWWLSNMVAVWLCCLPGIRPISLHKPEDPALQGAATAQSRL